MTLPFSFDTLSKEKSFLFADMASRENERKVFMDDMMYGLMFAGAITAGSVLAVVIFYVLVAVAQWRIFTKAGEAGWKGIIPLYNLYIQYKLTWDTKMFWYLIAVNLASSVLSFIASGFLIAIVTFILSLAGVVILIMGLHKLSKAFGHGAGFTLGLIFLNPIFLLILGFGSSQYMGNLSWPNQARF